MAHTKENIVWLNASHKNLSKKFIRRHNIKINLNNNSLTTQQKKKMNKNNNNNNNNNKAHTTTFKHAYGFKGMHFWVSFTTN